jgi:hypothetical protein
VQVKSPTIVGANTTQNVFDTVATTVNAFGAATAVNIGAATGVTTIEHDLTVQGGNINLNGNAIAGQQPFITFANQPDGVNSMYGIRGKSTVDDPWFLGAGSTGNDQGYLEIATGDNTGDPFGAGSPIYVRQYNGYEGGGTQVPWYGGTATVVNELVLLDEDGNTSVPNDLTVGGTVNASAVVIDGLAGINTNTTTTTSTSTVMIAQTTREVLKVIVFVKDNVTGQSHTVVTLLLRNNTSALLTTYAELYTAASLVSFTADVSAGFLRLLATPASTNNTTIDIVGVGLS